jgi:hypothetical protein
MTQTAPAQELYTRFSSPNPPWPGSMVSAAIVRCRVLIRQCRTILSKRYISIISRGLIARDTEVAQADASQEPSPNVGTIKPTSESDIPAVLGESTL